MTRTRDETRWKIPFQHYASPAEFSSASISSGGHCVMHRERAIDLLVLDRGAETTLVSFTNALPDAADTVPIFGGASVAQALNINLIAVSDPTLTHGDLSVGWYLGDQTTGPLKSAIVHSIAHALQELGSTNTILLGVEDGAYAAGHLAHEFDDCIALLINPQLNLTAGATHELTKYLRYAHGIDTNGLIDDTQHRLLEAYGPVHLEQLAEQGLNHHVLIYQNMFDAPRLQHQVLPFVQALETEPRCHVRLANDGPGAVSVRQETLLAMLRSLISGSNRAEAIFEAGFSPAFRVGSQVGEFLPEIAARLDELTKTNLRLTKERDALVEQRATMSDSIRELRDRTEDMDRRIQALTDTVEHLRQEPGFWHRVWQVLPRSVRTGLKKLFGGTDTTA